MVESWCLTTKAMVTFMQHMLGAFMGKKVLILSLVTFCPESSSTLWPLVWRRIEAINYSLRSTITNVSCVGILFYGSTIPRQFIWIRGSSSLSYKLIGIDFCAENKLPIFKKFSRIVSVFSFYVCEGVEEVNQSTPGSSFGLSHTCLNLIWRKTL